MSTSFSDTAAPQTPVISPGAYRYAIAIYALFAFYFWYLFHSLFRFLAQHYIPEGSRLSISHPQFGLTNHGVSAVLTGIIVIGMFASNRLKEYTLEVGDELTRVSWSTFVESRKSTGVVVVLVLISALFLSLVDLIFAKLINLTMGIAL